MKKPPKISDELLLDYIDGELSPEQMAFVDSAAGHPAIAARLKELKQVDQLLATPALEMPPRHFTQSVMANLDKPIKDHLPYSRRNGLIIMILALLTVVIGSMYMTESIISLNAFDTISFEQLNAPIEIPKMNLPDSINLKILTEGLLFTLVILALLLLDRVVLKPFFRSRRAEMQY